jgi:hypothetical protein
MLMSVLFGTVELSYIIVSCNKLEISLLSLEGCVCVIAFFVVLKSSGAGVYTFFFKSRSEPRRHKCDVK